VKLLFLSINIFCIFLNLKKKKEWVKERQTFAIRKKNLEFLQTINL